MFKLERKSKLIRTQMNTGGIIDELVSVWAWLLRFQVFFFLFFFLVSHVCGVELGPPISRDNVLEKLFRKNYVFNHDEHLYSFKLKTHQIVNKFIWIGVRIGLIVLCHWQKDYLKVLTKTFCIYTIHRLLFV